MTKKFSTKLNSIHTIILWRILQEIVNSPDAGELNADTHYRPAVCTKLFLHIRMVSLHYVQSERKNMEDDARFIAAEMKSLLDLDFKKSLRKNLNSVQLLSLHLCKV